MKHLAAFAALGLMALAAAAGAQDAPDWEALGNATTDCTAVFQRALDAAGAKGGGTVTVPAGRYRFDGTLSIPANVTLQGVYRVPPTSGPRPIAELTGSVLYAYAGRGKPDGPPFIKLAGSNAAIAGFIIAYPEWKQTTVPPVPYPPCIQSTDTENVGISECCLLNPYEGIKLVRAHRHLVRNITGYPIRRGLFVDECYDIGHVENIHYWPFGVSYNPTDPYCKWINTQGVAFELARTDWHYVSNTFCFGYGVGYLFSEVKHGGTNGNFLGLGADSCQRALVVEQAQPPGLLITNGEFVGRWSSEDAVCVEIGPKVQGMVSLVNCSFWGPIDRCVWMRAPEGQFTASACNFVHWDVRGVGSPAIQLDAGKAIVQACTFGQENLHVSVGKGVQSALVSTNQAEGGLRISNQAGKRTQAVANQADPINWTAAARTHFRIDVGATGDGRYLRGWHGQERLSGDTFRWSMAESQLMLPNPKGKSFTVTVDLEPQARAVSAAAGLYLGGKRLAALKAGQRQLVARVPATQADRVTLTLRVTGWVPQRVLPASQDTRTLGVQVRRVTVKADGAGPRVFVANTGAWFPAGAAKP